MSGAICSLMVQIAAVTTGGGSYQTAYQQSEKTGKPLVILVSAQWCPACRKVKNKTLPGLNKKGAMKDVVFVTLDIDKEKRMAAKLMRSRTIPQLIMFTRTAQGWQRDQIIGAKSAKEIRSFLKRGVARIAAAKAATRTK